MCSTVVVPALHRGCLACSCIRADGVNALQAYRNSVPVPRHWSQKRKYLQGKRGIEKPAFQLPDYIEATGIGEMRKAYQEKVVQGLRSCLLCCNEVYSSSWMFRRPLST